MAQRYVVRTYTEGDGLSSNMVYSVTQDTSGLLWFATRSGVCSYDGQDWITYAVDPSLKQFSFLVVFSDEKGTLWTIPHLGEPKVFKFSGTQWSLYAWDTVHHIKAYFSAFNVTYEDGLPVLALGTNEKGLFIFRKQRWSHFTTDNGLLSNQIRSLIWIGDRLVVATDKGISVIREDSVSNQWNSFLPPGFPGYLSRESKRLPYGCRICRRSMATGERLAWNTFHDRFFKSGFRFSHLGA